MQIVKLLKDFPKSNLQKALGDYLNDKLESSTCFVEIKNIDFMLQYAKPLNDFVVYTNQLPCNGVIRIN